MQKMMKLVKIATLLALTCTSPPLAWTGGVVSSCNQASLATAIAGGGSVTFSCSGTITLTSRITISANTSIDGSDQFVTISGGTSVQIFNIPSSVTLSINELTIANGNGAGAGGNGGAIANSGSLTVTNSALSSNAASSSGGQVNGIGGGIYNTGTLTVSNSTFSNNAAGWGAGVYNEGGTLTVTSSTFSSNLVGSYGGGINNDSGTATVTSSTFSGNIASRGGGIENLATLTITASTFSGNSSSAGGGIDNFGALTVTNSTFSGHNSSAIQTSNTATISNSTLAGNSGGGLSGGLLFTVRNTILANTGNCSAGIADESYNLDTDGTCGFSSANHSLSNNHNANLGTLSNNGGPTQTIPLLVGSAAIDVIPVGTNGCGTTVTTDQRGITRPQGSQCDIGAYELIQVKKRLGQVTSE